MVVALLRTWGLLYLMGRSSSMLDLQEDYVGNMVRLWSGMTRTFMRAAVMVLVLFIKSLAQLVAGLFRAGPRWHIVLLASSLAKVRLGTISFGHRFVWTQACLFGPSFKHDVGAFHRLQYRAQPWI